MLKLIFKNHYHPVFKLLFDFFYIVFIFYLVNQLFDLSILDSNPLNYLIFSLSSIFIFYVLKVYHSMYRYFNLNDSLRLLMGISLNSIIFFIFTGNFEKMIVLNHLLFFFLLASFLTSYRIFIKVLFSKINKVSEYTNNILIFGAGNSGIITKRAFYNSSEFKMSGFIDDDKSKKGKTLDGVTVFEIGNELNKFILKNNISKVIISTKKLSVNRQSFLFKYFQNLNIQILKLPPVESWVNGIPDIYNLKEIKIGDLLNRGLIKIDIKKNELLYFGKSILVTGAAGSIGSEIIRQVIKFKPARIILLDNSETPMFNIKGEIEKVSNNIELIYFINSITDKKALNKIFSLYKIDIVFHAAAYKHVNMMEANPRSAVINNIYGTKLIIDFSIKFNVYKFVLISSDKAVNPTNVMGASKRICELYLASKISDQENKTKFITTRFGNVLGSNGSVVPIFEKQISKGGPITITHRDIVRYFMTIIEASQLVIEAGAIAKGGEVFVFDMGEPVKIYDLAKKMIIQKGLKVGIDINIEISGLRPGEKLYEELLVDTEKLVKTHNELIFIAKKELVGNELSNLIDKLINTSLNDFDNFKIVGLMKKIVPEYISNQSEFQILDKK